MIGYFVTDNAPNNDTAIEALLKHFFPGMTEQRRRARRLRCLGHVLNLSAKAFLFGTEYDAFERDVENVVYRDLVKELKLWRKRGPVGKLHNIIIFITRSPQRRGKFAEIRGLNSEEKGDFDHLNLVIDNATRWNSLYSMIERSLKLRDRIDHFCINYADHMHGAEARKRAQTDEEREQLLSHDILTADDWHALSEVLAILKPFHDLTLRGEGSLADSSRGLLFDYMPTLNILLKHMQRTRDDLTRRCADDELITPSLEYLKSCTINSWTKIDEYFLLADSTGAVYAAVVTRPQSKWKYFQTTWKDFPRTWLTRGKNALDLLWNEYLDLDMGDAGEAGTRRQRERTPDDYQKETDMTLLDDDEPEDQLKAWLDAKPFALEEPLIDFWRRLRGVKTTARVAQLGLDMASIPLMSSECERVFSQGKLLITGQRHRLKVDIIEATQCLRAWLIIDRKRENKWRPSKKREKEEFTCMVPDIL